MVPILNGVLGKEGRGAACVGVSMLIFYLVVLSALVARDSVFLWLFFFSSLTNAKKLFSDSEDRTTTLILVCCNFAISDPNARFPGCWPMFSIQRWGLV